MPIVRSCRRDKIIATISIPPVEAPYLSETPTATPLITPPTTALKIISSQTVIISSIYKKKVAKITDNILYSVKPRAILNQPIISTGTFKQNSLITTVISSDKKTLHNHESNLANPLKELA